MREVLVQGDMLLFLKFLNTFFYIYRRKALFIAILASPPTLHYREQDRTEESVAEVVGRYA